MVKSHNVLMEIQNSSGIEMKYKTVWYDSGRVANEFSWPSTIGGNDYTEKILSYEED